MLTAAKMAAAILYAGLAWYVSELIKPLFPEGQDLGWFSEVNAVIAAALAWNIAGSRAGGSWAAAVSYGLTTTIAMTFWGIFLQSGGEMIRQSLRKLYDGPSEAVVAVFGLMFEYGQLMATPQVLGTLLAGGVVAGLLVEICGRNFR
jgi:hypothetical protein